MTAVELMDSILAVTAKKETLEDRLKKEGLAAAKTLNKILTNGWVLDKYQYIGTSNTEAYWAICNYNSQLEQLYAYQNKLNKLEAKLVTLQAKYDKAIKNQ